MPNKLYLDYVEFYITNVCNLACEGCNRFNDRKFKGWQPWQEHADAYRRWSKELFISNLSIMGGEPLLNPTFYEWVLGLRELWPNARIMIASNGTQLEKHQQLYEILRADPKTTINISIHNKLHKQQLIDKVKNFLTAPFEYQFDHTPYQEKLIITDANQVTVRIGYDWWFHQGSIVRNENGKETLHQSDPETAHAICHAKTCHHFDHGRLYKCGPVALFPQYDQQFGLDLSPADRELMLSYRSLGAEDSIEVKQEFLNNIKNSIPQCRFCPSSYKGKQIFSLEKKDLPPRTDPLTI
jgi:organic radical activating enzyme